MELVILVLAVIAHIAIGFFILSRNTKSYTNRFFFLFTLFSAIWGVVNYLSLIQTSPEATLTMIRWVMFFALLYSVSLFLTIHTFPSAKLQLSPIKLGLLVIVSLGVLVLTQTPYVFQGIEGIGANAQPQPGPAIAAFALTVGFCILGSIFLLISHYRKAKGVYRSQLQYLIIGVIGSAFLIFLTNFLLVVAFNNTSLIFLGPTYTLVFIIATAYAIVAHQLFDIRVIIRRTVIYSGLLLFTLGTYSMIVFFITQLFGSDSPFDVRRFIANLIAASFIAVGFDPLRKYLTSITDKYLFKGEYDRQAVLAQLSEQLSLSVDLRQAAQAMVSTIRSNVRLNHAAVITFNIENRKALIKDVVQEGYVDSSVLQLRPENLLLQQFALAPKVLVTEELSRFCEDTGLSSPEVQACQMLMVDLRKLQVGIAIPIMMGEKAIGIFLVGEKLSGDMFAKEEVEFLKIVASQTTNAIQKARFWEEDQLKSEFVSIASHELLTPTAAIKGYLSMILDDNLGQVDETARGFLVKVAGSADRLANLVEDLLNVSRIESGRLKINKSDFSLAEMVQKAVDELSVNANTKGLDLAFVPPTAQFPTVYADADHIYRVLINLIGNAIKYTPQGWVRCFVTQQDPGHLLFAVTDSGLGIPAENIPHLFEKFYRADRRAINGIQGTGLGLYISKKIVEIMGGQMWLTTEEGKGTTFYVTIPISGTVSV